jgi:hypothetical protein
VAQRLEYPWLLGGNTLVFTVQPTDCILGLTSGSDPVINTASGVQVSVESASGQFVTNNSDTITLQPARRLQPCWLSGTLQLNGSDGLINSRRRTTDACSTSFGGVCVRFH